LNSEWVLIGRIRSPHGIRGEVVVDSYTDFPQRLAKDSLLYLSVPDSSPQPLRIKRSRRHKSAWIVEFEHLKNRSDAEAIRNRDLLIPEVSLQRLPAGHYYPHQLLGCEVVIRSGEVLGTVTRVLALDSNPLLEVNGQRGEILIPMVETILVDVSLDQRRLTVDLPAGLLELNP
jgi:16S rRNA processing protein RimM